MIYLAVSDNEEAFWIQILVVVILAAGFGIYGLVKTREKRRPAHKPAHHPTPAVSVEANAVAADYKTTAAIAVEQPTKQQKKRNLTGGMELLTTEFLLAVVEQTDTADQQDFVMRRMCFNELARRGELGEVESNPLKVYVLDKNELYGKSIQCAAMKELVERTNEISPDEPTEQNASAETPAQSPTVHRVALQRTAKPLRRGPLQRQRQ